MKGSKSYIKRLPHTGRKGCRTRLNTETVFPLNVLLVTQLLLSLPSQMESPGSTPAVLPLHLLVPVVSNDISSPCEQIMVRTRSVGVNTCDVALATEPECLGPCEPGTSVNLEGIVWQETEDGKSIVWFCHPFSICFYQQELIVVNNTKYLLGVSSDRSLLEIPTQRVTATFLIRSSSLLPVFLFVCVRVCLFVVCFNYLSFIAYSTV